MTKGDKIKLRAELAGKAMAALISNANAMGRIDFVISMDKTKRRDKIVAVESVAFADALMAELGLSLDKED